MNDGPDELSKPLRVAVLAKQVPRSRQVGITGRSIAPRPYIAIGVGGRFNHLVAIRRAGTVLAINGNPAAPMFESADIGIVSDWREVVPALAEELGTAMPRDTGTTGPARERTSA